MQSQTLRIFWQNTWRYKKHVVGIALLLPITVLMHQFLPPLVLSGILSRLAAGEYVHGDLWGSFGAALALFVFLRFVSASFMWRMIIFLLNSLEGRVSTRLSQRIFDRLLSQSTRFHADHQGGSLVAGTTRFINAYSQLASSTVMQFIPLILSFIYVTIILLPRAPLYIVCLLIFTAAYITITVLQTRLVREKTNEHAMAQGAQTGHLADALTNILAVKTSAAESYERTRFRQSTQHTENKFFEMIKLTQKRELGFTYITASITSVSIVLAIASVVVFNADIATAFLIIEYTGLLTGRLWEFTISTLRTYNRAIGEAADMTAILQLPPDVKDPAKPEAVRISKGLIKFDNVNFIHSNAAKPTFSGLSVTIKPGERVGLVGHSGAGKTTFVKLLMRLSDVDEGAIRIDGQDIRAISQASLRQNIAFVPQEPLLFHRSIKENIAYGLSSVADKDICAAAKKAHASEFIEQLPQKYDTIVGERGVKLSGGQRQRIAIARAILRQSPILILDEATSALDSESERKIQKAIQALMHQRTTIAIAHRLSTIQHLDRILVFKNGKIIEDGSHDELLKQGGTYASLWAHQSGGFITEG